MRTAPGGVPMVTHSDAGAPGPSLILMTDAERNAAAFACGVLTELARDKRWSESIAKTYTENAEVLRRLLDRVVQ